MTRNTRLLALTVMVAAVAGLALLSGCPRQEPPGVGPGAPPPPPPGPAVGTGPLAEIEAAQAKLTSYKLVMTAPDGEVIEQFVKTQAGEPLKMKMATPDGWVMMDFEDKVMIAYSPAEKTAMKMPMDMPGAEDMDDLKLPGTDLKALEGKDLQVSDETLDGAAVLLVEYTDEGDTIRVWMDKETGLPRQMQADEEVIKVAIEMVNQVPDAEFEIPAGTEIIDMSQLMMDE